MNPPQTEQSLLLEAKLDLMAAASLGDAIAALQNTPVSLDAANVSHLDMPCLQILLSAAKHWQGTNTSFSISNPTDAFLAGLATLGIDPLIFQKSETV